MISLTEAAAKEFIKVMKAEGLNPEEVALRISIKGGGCSGFTYVLDFDDTQRRVDLFFESNGMGILVDKKSYLFIKDTVIDYSYDLNHHGVNFKNPQALSSCGCRSSFAIDISNEHEEPVFKPNW